MSYSILPYSNDVSMLKKMKDPELLSAAHTRVKEEKNATLAVLHCLREIERRRLHLARGFQSLHDFATRELGYSPAAAQRRILAMRLLREIPEVEKKIEQGLISLDSAARAQGFFKNEEKATGNFPLERKKEILSQLEGKSSRQCERVLATLSSHPEAFLRPDSIKPVGAASVEVRFVAEQGLVEDLNRLRELLSHKNPSMSLAELIAELAKVALAELDPEKSRVKKPALNEQPATPAPARKSSELKLALSKQPATPAPERKRQMDSQMDSKINPKIDPKIDPNPQPGPSPRSRYIPIKLKRAIFERDGYRCTYTDPLTGRRCGSRFQLELDHWRVPFAWGGEHSALNLRTTCKRHNLWLAIQTFGISKIAKYQNKNSPN